MSISIITPHYNDLEGLIRIHGCLLNQDSDQWEWIIVDDCSDTIVRTSLTAYFKQHNQPNIHLILNTNKTNGSVCRNIGVDHASNNRLVFLDSDDKISEGFVSNRIIEVGEFVVYKNFYLIDEKGSIELNTNTTSNYLDHFLQAKFIWQTSAILWNKDFFINIGKFNADLKRLQDVELSIRALILGKNYMVIDNKEDFFYCVAPIDINKRPVHLICESVNYLINYIHDNYQLDERQRNLVKGYYFLCVRYFSRSKNKGEIVHVRNSLKLFFKKNYVSYFGFWRALLFLRLYEFDLISNGMFVRLNRFFYK